MPKSEGGLHIIPDKSGETSSTGTAGTEWPSLAEDENKVLARLALVQERVANKSHMNDTNKGKGTILI
jgi:hypothetical protein